MSNEMKDWIRDTVQDIYKKHPWMAPVDWEGNREDVSEVNYTWLDDLPVGWSLTFGMEFLEELDNAMTSEEKERYHVFQVKEKYGEMRWYGSFETEAMSKVINKYAEISRHTCVFCGEPTNYMTTGWIMPMCEICAEIHHHNIKAMEE